MPVKPKSIRILLADDHNVMRRGLRLLLENQPGFTVVAEAADGRLAVQQAQAPRTRTSRTLSSSSPAATCAHPSRSPPAVVAPSVQWRVVYRWKATGSR